MTAFIKKLKIPVVIVGIGLRADYEPDLSKRFSFDEAAKEFISAVLDKSQCIGLRGQITADYLHKLGFLEETHYSVIGCPSMYTYGSGIYLKQIPEELKRIAINTNNYYNIGHINELFLNTVNEFEDIYLIQQMQEEFTDLYIGSRFLLNDKKKNIPKNILGEKYADLKKADRVRYFFDIISWVNFLKGFDLFVGDRFHGSAAAILAGTPHIMLPFNARTREMVEYHRLTSLSPYEVREGTSIADYLDKLDFGSFEKPRDENLDHYIDFLKKNGLEDNIFKIKLSWKQGESPLERMIQEMLNQKIENICMETHCFDSLNRREQVKRLAGCYEKTAKAVLGRRMKKKV